MEVLFVCLGNICRSPTAEGVLRHKLREAGLAGQVEVASAGTGHWHVGNPPDQRSQRAALARGYDLSAQRAQQVSRADFERYDLILAMDHSNLRNLNLLQPGQGRAQVDLFLRRYGAEVDEVPDPYYEGEQGFERVLDLIERACDLLVIELKGRL
ncbi:low molecular weight protein-tyrosine-phosphatase [Pseudomonas sp. R11F]|uniref:protein-tyrosine-phosphatase n=1 Tax=Pseudomonas palleroniana TaxID=191390 RepID=A0A1H5NKD7_9PSED|nr:MULTISPECIES: low molecular weight protein-tyrosine-phosphatase [Pseudomonas]AVE04369.1 low molecular weight phosphotyrosine protein phosphatase [Pseudomonas palleroniana]KAB0570139.1 low molecular weight phosphotyrosine protein phosphatase [Pseudomonas palleroniana]KWU49372.1 protein-tyrosine-phosphatase [Pseudomonas palleroniana]MBI6910194.1 low molecular weight phosphotyrosine protein phosphatase [Pseudomonas palleroniana]MBM9488500.1 low molecular weight phosphotyrosine protein phosphat